MTGQSTDDLFDLIFRGDILPGHSLPEVKLRMMQLFRIDEVRINALFAAGVVPLKRDLSRADAEKYQQAIHRIGADVRLAPAGTVQQRLRPARAESGATKSPSLAERLATLSPPPASPAAALFSAREPGSAPAAPAPVQPPAPAPTHSGSGLPLVSVEEIEDVEPAGGRAAVAAGSLSLAPPGTEVLTAAERRVWRPVAIDTSALSVRAAGAELLDRDERAPVAAVVVNIDGLSVAEVGTDLLAAAEKLPVAVVAPDSGGLSLAPVGSVLGQLARGAVPPAPDTGHLQVVSDPE